MTTSCAASCAPRWREMASGFERPRPAPRRSPPSPSVHPTCSSSTSAFPTPTAATSVKRSGPAAWPRRSSFLTARDALTDRLSGFHSGGDDYLIKPFAVAELMVRIQALLRRSPPKPPAADAGALWLDPAAHGVAGPNEIVPLTPTEFRLLAELAAHSGEVVRRSALVRAGWPGGAIVSANTLDAYVSRIRAKLRQAAVPQTVENVRGVGYSLQ